MEFSLICLALCRTCFAHVVQCRGRNFIKPYSLWHVSRTWQFLMGIFLYVFSSFQDVTLLLTFDVMQQPLSKEDWNVFWIFERRILRIIYGPVNDTGIWRTRYNNEYDELDIVKAITTWRLRWLGHLFRMQEVGPCRKLTVLKPEGTTVGKPKLRCLESVEEGLKNVGIRTWRRK